jgi:hypothetical protein
LGFRVSVDSGSQAVNELYGIRADEVETVTRTPDTTDITGGENYIYLPIVMRNAP